MNTNPSSKSPVQQAQFPWLPGELPMQSSMTKHPSKNKGFYTNYNYDKPITALQEIRAKNWTWAVLVLHV